MTYNGKSSYDLLCQVLSRLDRMEDKMDQRLCAVEKRVDVIEDFRSKILGMAIFLGAISGSVVHWVWMKVTGEE